MTIRTFADIRVLIETGDLSDAEQKLIRNCKSGEETTLGDGERPSGPSPERTIRADLLRYLILGGCDNFCVHEIGIQLKGAWVRERLDLNFTKASGSTRLLFCGFEEEFEANQTSFALLDLTGSALFGLTAEDLRVCGDLVFDGADVRAEFNINGAEIGGQLTGCNSKLTTDGAIAFAAQGVTIEGGVFLRDTKLNGAIDINGSVIGGQLSCERSELKNPDGFSLHAQGARIRGGVFLDGAKSIGTVNLAGANIEVQMDFENATFVSGENEEAINGQHMTVRGAFLWRKVRAVEGAVKFYGAHLQGLADDEESWRKVKSLTLVGLTYDDLVGPMDLCFRKAWLKMGARGLQGRFHPQPYQQLAKFYRETGHRGEAREVLIEKEIELREDARSSGLDNAANIGEWAKIKTRFGNDFRWFWDILSRQIAGYGYKPWRSIFPLLTLVAIMTVLSLTTWRSGDFAPNSDVILTSPDWTILAENASLTNPAQRWADKHGPGQDYETFAALAYGFDVVVPILNLGQTDAWAPSTSRSRVGWWVFYLEKIFVVLGWGVTAIVAAAVTGMIRRDD